MVTIQTYIIAHSVASAIMSVPSVQLPVLNWDALDLGQAFKEWKAMLTSYFVICGVADDKQWHYILMSSGSKGHNLFNSWAMQDAQKADPAKVFKKFEHHLIGTPNKWVMRLELSSLMQKQGELIDDFICRLQSKASLCSFPTEEVRDQEITFQLIKGILWPDERKTLISKGNDLSLKDAIKSAQAYQATMQNTSSFALNNTNTQTHTVNAFNRGCRRECRFCGTNL